MEEFVEVMAEEALELFQVNKEVKRERGFLVEYQEVNKEVNKEVKQAEEFLAEYQGVMREEVLELFQLNLGQDEWEETLVLGRKLKFLRRMCHILRLVSC